MTIYGIEWENDDDRDECWSLPIIYIMEIDLQKVMFLKFTTVYSIYSRPFHLLNIVPFCIRRRSIYEFKEHMMLRIYIRSET